MTDGSWFNYSAAVCVLVHFKKFDKSGDQSRRI